jgi:AcrR family transcriptional regulator
MVIREHREPASHAKGPVMPVGDGVDTRTRLLIAADEILAREGIQALTQTHVAEVVGLRQSHLTYYFPTRSDLIKALVEFAAVRVRDDLCGSPGGPPLTLEDFRGRLIERLSDPTTPKRMIGMSVAMDEDPSLRAVARVLEARVRESLGAALRQIGIPVSELDVTLLHATLVGIALQGVTRRSDVALRQTRELLGAAVDRLVALRSQNGGAHGAPGQEAT